METDTVADLPFGISRSVTADCGCSGRLAVAGVDPPERVLALSGGECQSAKSRYAR